MVLSGVCVCNMPQPPPSPPPPWSPAPTTQTRLPSSEGPASKSQTAKSERHSRAHTRLASGARARGQFERQSRWSVEIVVASGLSDWGCWWWQLVLVLKTSARNSDKVPSRGCSSNGGLQLLGSSWDADCSSDTDSASMVHMSYAQWACLPSTYRNKVRAYTFLSLSLSAMQFNPQVEWPRDHALFETHLRWDRAKHGICLFVYFLLTSQTVNRSACWLIFTL